MFKMRKDQISELQRFAMVADREARSDLALGYITSENDYTSNFTGALRRIINSNSQTGLSAHSFRLNGATEQKYGCDAVIAVVSNNYAKFAYFEAKWPRIKHVSYPWDIVPKGKTDSHFSSQLERQANILPSAVAKFEMFYCEEKFGQQPPYMNPDTSSCVWHDDAYAYDQKRAAATPWQTADLSKLMAKKQQTISDILLEVCECRAASPVPVSAGIESMARELRLEAPILAVTAGDSGGYPQ